MPDTRDDARKTNVSVAVVKLDMTVVIEIAWNFYTLNKNKVVVVVLYI